jgi:acetyl-CoA synthetase
MTTPTTLTSGLKEHRTFAPPEGFRRRAWFNSPVEWETFYRRSLDEPEAFWREASKGLDWATPWHTLLDWSEPFARWFTGGTLNACANCVDRHAGIDNPRRNKAAIVFEGEPGDRQVLTYGDLLRQVRQLAHVLRSRGVVAGDRVAIYLPMIPEAVIAMLACARIGATHSVVFGGFSAHALADRIVDAGAKLVITADGGWRRGAIVPLKAAVDEALVRCGGGGPVTDVLVVKRTAHEVTMQPGRDHWLHELMAAAPVGDVESTRAAMVDAEHPLFVLYTSGSTGRPKGVVHSTAGYLLHAQMTAKYIFDLRDEDLYFCTADVGWVTGHSYIVYGPLANGATVLLYEGAPNWPQPDRIWSLIETYGVTILYTAPTAIRAFMRAGEQWPARHDLSSLRLLGTVGEPINPEAWMWYRHVIGGGRCPIVDTWWQTETGGVMLTTLPGVHATKPGSAGVPMWGVSARIVSGDGQPVAAGDGGYLVIDRPWPSMLRTVFNDAERYRKTYWSEVPHVYFAGDGARVDADGRFWIMGRIDDVVNVAGHRLGTAEIESALVGHPRVAEAAVVSRADALKGEALVAFVVLRQAAGSEAEDPKALCEALRQQVATEIGAIAKPDEIRLVDALPKTRSGKIMRRLLRSIAAGGEMSGDLSTLEDHSILEKLRTSGE